MKNIQVIDGADNCTFTIYQVTDDEFAVLFPEPGQDQEFIEDVLKRLGLPKLNKLMKPIWERPIEKPKALGIHGTLFYQFDETRRRWFPPTKRECDWDLSALPPAVRRLYSRDS